MGEGERGGGREGGEGRKRVREGQREEGEAREGGGGGGRQGRR